MSTTTAARTHTTPATLPLPLLDPPNYTQIPNALLDIILPRLHSLASLKLLLILCRLTFGWHRDRTPPLSLRRLETLTGMTRENLIPALAHLTSHGLIDTHDAKGQHGKPTHTYSLRLTTPPTPTPSPPAKPTTTPPQIVDNSPPTPPSMVMIHDQSAPSMVMNHDQSAPLNGHESLPVSAPLPDRNPPRKETPVKEKRTKERGPAVDKSPSASPTIATIATPQLRFTQPTRAPDTVRTSYASPTPTPTAPPHATPPTPQRLGTTAAFLTYTAALTAARAQPITASQGHHPR